MLGDIPLLGRVFRREVQESKKTELVLLITPHVLMTPSEGEEATRARMRDLSQHPYHTQGDAALDASFRKIPKADSPIGSNSAAP